MPSLEIVMAEFGEVRANAGDAALPPDQRLEPSLSSFRKHFPEAHFAVYTDQSWSTTDLYEVRQVESPFARHPREGNRLNDLYDAIGLLESKADYAVAIDSDLLIVNPQVRTLIPLTEKFKFCMPTNSRRMGWVDFRSTCDGGKVTDASLGCGPARCTALWSLKTDSIPHRHLLQAYRDQIIDDARCNRGARGPLSLWRAEWATGISPFALPNEWCVTGSSCGRSEIDGRTVPIILHAGHSECLTHYAALIESERNR